MTTPPAPLQLEARYRRSVHLERDFAQRANLEGYQVTPLVLQTIERMLAALKRDATSRAFSLIGPYGSGKSAFGLFLAHFLRSKSNRRKLLQEHAIAGLPQRPISGERSLLPVLLSGNNSPLRIALLRALYTTLNEQSPRLRTETAALLAELDAAVTAPELDPQLVAELYERAAEVVYKHSDYSGIVLIVDELGQFLDYAARQDQRDLFVLQTMAEMAARTQQASFLIVTILHQAFDRYVASAGLATRAEWRKVQGRFIDLPFLEPDSQLLRMVGQALAAAAHADDATQRDAWAAQLAPHTAALGLRPADLPPVEWHQLLAQTFPLHPSVLVILPTLFRQLAQNERSLFAFLSAQEPGSLPDFLRNAPHSPAAAPPLYRLPQLYAYVEATLGPSLFGRTRGRRWAEVAAMREQLLDLPALAADLLTTIGTLGALGLRAGPAQLAFALRDQPEQHEVAAALALLLEKRLIAYRKYRASYVLWEGSDFDLDGLLASARQIIADQTSLVRLLQQQAAPTPLLAYRHSYRTGSLRHFSARFCDAHDLPNQQPNLSDADGALLYVVPSDDDALVAARAWAQDAARSDQPWLIAVLPQRVELLREVLLDVAALRHVLATQPELEHDRAARLELSARLDEASQSLEQAIRTIYGPGASAWYWQARHHEVPDEKQLDELLSSACDQSYRHTPLIWNELIVRRTLSSAAAKARRNLVEAMLDQAHQATLGLSGYPPERAIYESVLHKSGIHRQDNDGVWRFGPPTNRAMQLDPVWDLMQHFLEDSHREVRPLGALYDQLAAPPYGLKAGLIPLLFIALYLANVGQIAVYEYGNYVPVPDIATFERLLRNHSHFSLRYSQVSGVRVAVFERIARAFAPQALHKDGQLALNDAVTPLLRFVVKLPAYSRQTRRVSARAQAIRQTMLATRAPDELLFEQLPHACGLPPFTAAAAADDAHFEAFFAALRSGLDELQNAYQCLIDEVREEIRRAFAGLADSSAALRAELTTRYLRIAAETSDTQLRAVGMRLENAGPDEAWVESIAALVARKPLNTWQDPDVQSFATLISDLGRRFKLVEQVTVARQALPPETPVLRIGIADAQGEQSLVIARNDQAPGEAHMRSQLQQSLVQHGLVERAQQIYALADLLRALLAEPEREGA